LYSCIFVISTAEVKDDAPELADLYFLYGKALLENAISQAGVLGKDQPAGAEEEEEGESSHSYSSKEPPA
jgi:HAT1-interacting factor 1